MNHKNEQIDNLKYKPLLNNLIKIAVNGLHEMYLPEQLEFALKKKLVDKDIVLEDRSTRYTLINLLGLHKSKKHNIPIQINLNNVLAKHISDADIYNSIGDLGLLLWATALISPESISDISTKINFNNILEKYKDAKSKQTMELSWLLTGLLLASTNSDKFKNSIGDLTQKVFLEIRNNYGGVGIFKHQGNNTIVGKFRNNVASFADQVYPIYAFALYSKYMKNEDALVISKQCALKICEHQGQRGEWMWHYNSSTGKVISKYPVYSVHQDAMAPMALFAIQDASNTNFEEYIFKGLDWLVESNSLSANMIDGDLNAIWRAISPGKIPRKLKSILSVLGIKTNEEYDNLEIVKECWSYHLGWILYAFSGRLSDDKDIFSQNDFEKFNFQNNNIN
jgi:hypothetical protein